MPIGIPDVNYPGGGAVGWTATGLTVPAWTSYLVTVDGRTTATRNPAATQCSPGVTFPAEGSYGPSGTAYYELRVAAGWSADGTTPSSIQLNYVGYGPSGGNTATSDTLFAWSGGQLYVQRSGLAGVVGGGTPHCEAGLYLLSTTQAISLTTFDGQELSLTPSAVAVRRGTDVTFTATSRGAVVSTPNWRFDVDSGVTNETTLCGGLSGPNPCLVTVRTSGVLRASKNVQGRMRVAAARVRVYTNFTLTGDPSDVVRGDSVRFTPKLDGATGPAARWLWRGDDATVVAAPCAAQTDSCVWVPQGSGTMWAYTAATGGDSAFASVTVRTPALELTASKSTLIAPGENDTFTATGNGPTVIQGWSFTPDSTGGAQPSVAVGDAWGNCTSSSTTCTNLVNHSGMVLVIGTVHGVQRTDTVRVFVGPSRLTLEANSTAVLSGDTVTFTLRHDGTITPADHWRWSPDSVGTGTTACAYNVATCKKQITESGVMWATFGQDSASARVILRIALGGGCDGATLSRSSIGARKARSTASTTFALPQQAAYECVPDPNPSGPDSLLIDCHLTGTPTAVPMRGQSVSCSARLRSAKRFTFTATGSAKGNVSGATSWPVGFTTVDSTFYASVGSAVITTTISGEAIRHEDAAVLLSSMTFIVASRPTVPIALTRPQAVFATPAELNPSPLATEGNYLTFGQYPSYIYDVANAAPSPQMKVVPVGPDSGLAFIEVLPDTAPGGAVLINQALTGVGTWAADQADANHTDTAPKPYYNSRWCRPADYAHLLDITQIHEGSTGNGLPPLAAYPNRPGTSHYDIRRRAFAEHLAGLLEGLVMSQEDALDRYWVWTRINNVLNMIHWQYAHPADSVFDSIEDQMPVLYSSERFACQDFYPWKGGKR